MADILLYGAGGHGRVIADVIRCQGRFKSIIFIDDDPSRTGSRIDAIPVWGTSARLRSSRKDGARWAIVCIGDNRLRLSKARVLERLGFRLATAVHPEAVVARDAVLGPGTVVMGGAVVNPGARIGRNVIVNTGATVDHDCVLGEGVHVAPGAHLAGNVTLGRVVHVGIGAALIQGVRVGPEAVVGAGAVVLRDVPRGATVVGNPARSISASKEPRR